MTEELAMRELDQIVRLKHLGVRFDYYMMDAFWFDPNGAYREWRKPNWPNGPDRWIAECRRNGLRPGLWFSTNTLVKINAAPLWRDSLNAQAGSLSFSEGGFLPDFMNVLQYWHDRGIRMFKFDFVDFSAATPQAERTQSPEAIRARNETAFREALKKFRERNPDVVLEAFNGFGGDVESTDAPFPFLHAVDLRWLEIFDAMYSGDPRRPSDVPEMNFWRSVDIYSDHMVRRYEQSGLPLERIDSTAFMIGNTGTIYYRKTNAWKGMLLLMVARGGWINTIHGNLEFLSDDDARWFAKVQSIFGPLQALGRTKSFGGIPGEEQPYGFGWCPDCGVHNSMQILIKNLELARKELLLATTTDSELANHLIGDALENAVSAFDGFGRELCRRRAIEIRFQSLNVARRKVQDAFGPATAENGPLTVREGALKGRPWRPREADARREW